MATEKEIAELTDKIIQHGQTFVKNAKSAFNAVPFVERTVQLSQELQTTFRSCPTGFPEERLEPIRVELERANAFISSWAGVEQQNTVSQAISGSAFVASAGTQVTGFLAENSGNGNAAISTWANEHIKSLETFQADATNRDFIVNKLKTLYAGGEAICRMERADFDFNLRTNPPTDVPAGESKERRTRLRQLSRERYGTPRQIVEEELARSRAEPERVDPFAERTARISREPEPRQKPEPVEPKAPVASSEPVPLPKQEPPKATVRRPPGEPRAQGKGDPEHKYLQQVIRQLGQQHGWRSDIEGNEVDVALFKGDTSIACEILNTTGASHDLKVIRKRLAAGFTWLAMLATEPRHLARAEDQCKSQLAENELQRIRFLRVEELHDLLEELDASNTAHRATILGYQVDTSYKSMSSEQKRARRERLAKAVAAGVQRVRNRRK